MNRFDKYREQPSQPQGANRFAKYTQQEPQPTMGKTEAVGRGVLYGAIQQPRDVAAAAYAKIFGGVPFDQALEDAKAMSLEGKQGEAKTDHPAMFGAGQLAGNIALTATPAGWATKGIGATAPALAHVPLAGKALSGTARAVGTGKGLVGVPAAGAVEGAVFSGMTEGDLSGATIGAAGSTLTSAAGKIARPIAKGTISKVREGYTNTLKAAGIDNLTPAQLTGSKNLETVESVLNHMIPTAGASRNRTEGQLKKFTRAALQKAGIDADEVTPQVRAMAEATFSKRYDNLLKGQTVKIDHAVLDTMADLTTKQLDKLPTNVRPIVSSYMRDIVQAGGKMSGAAYQEARSNLSAQARAMANSDPFTASMLRRIRNTLDDAAERSLPKYKKGEWRKLNREYANYKVIQKAASRVSEDSLEGILSPAALLQAVETANKTKSQKGYGDLYELARAGRAALPDKVPNSGTAQRQAVQQLLTAGALGAGAGGAAYGQTQDPLEAAKWAALGLAGPKAAQLAIQSPAGQRYFTQGLPVLNQLATPTARKLSALLAAGATAE